MTWVIENKTFEELHVGDTASVTRRLLREDIRAWMALAGNPHLEDGFIEGRGVVGWATALFANLASSSLPGIGSVVESAVTTMHGPIPIGAETTVTLVVREKRDVHRSVLLDGRCTDSAGNLIASATLEVLAPRDKVREERAEYRLDDLVERCRGLPAVRTAVVHPCSRDALLGAIEAARAGLIEPILVGPETRIRQVAADLGVDVTGYSIISTASAESSAARAAGLAGTGEAQALMKGSLHSDEMLHAVVSKDSNLRTGRLLSHCMVVAAPTYARRIIISDAAVNIAPNIDQKRDICQNAIILARALGTAEPKVAILSAVETVSTKIPSTMDAAVLAKMAERHQIVGGIVDGPLALDNAVDEQAARTKGIASPVAGKADILIAPNLEAGNMMYKELAFMADAQAAGVVVGARVPVILTSRADSAEARLFSAAAAVLYAHAIHEDPSLLVTDTPE